MPVSAQYSVRLKMALVPVPATLAEAIAAGLLCTTSAAGALSRPPVSAELSATVCGVTGTRSSSMADVPTRSSPTCAWASDTPAPQRRPAISADVKVRFMV